MKSFRKITAWAMALAIASTASAVTAFAEEAEVSGNVIVEVAENPTIAPTEAPVASTIVSGTIGKVEITVNIATNEVTFKDTETGMTAELKGNTVNFDGSVIQGVDISNAGLTEEEHGPLIKALLTAAGNVKVDTFNFSDNVTEVKEIAFDELSENLMLKFGKNITAIADNLLDDSTSQVTVYGYKGTAAETFASAKNFTFVPLDEPAVTTTVTEAAEVTTTEATTTELSTTSAETTEKATTAKKTTAKKTTAKKTTAKKSKTTAKSNDSPKTGDAGTGAAAGVALLAAVTGAFALRKKEQD